MASTGLSRSKFEMKESWGAPFVRVVVGRVVVDGEAILWLCLMWVLGRIQMMMRLWCVKL